MVRVHPCYYPGWNEIATSEVQVPRGFMRGIRLAWRAGAARDGVEFVALQAVMSGVPDARAVEVWESLLQRRQTADDVPYEAGYEWHHITGGTEFVFEGLRTRRIPLPLSVAERDTALDLLVRPDVDALRLMSERLRQRAIAQDEAETAARALKAAAEREQQLPESLRKPL